MSLQKDLNKFSEAEQVLILALYKKYTNIKNREVDDSSLVFAQVLNFLDGQSVDINKAQVSEHKKEIFNKKYLPKIKDYADFIMSNDKELFQLIIITLRLRAKLLTELYGSLWRDTASGIRTNFVLDRYGTATLINAGVTKYRAMVINFHSDVEKGRSMSVDWFDEL